MYKIYMNVKKKCLCGYNKETRALRKRILEECYKIINSLD